MVLQRLGVMVLCCGLVPSIAKASCEDRLLENFVISSLLPLRFHEMWALLASQIAVCLTCW